MDTQTAHHHATIRVEDDALMRGRGWWDADAEPQGRVYGFFVRSPHAFARIVKIDTDAARKERGVIAVLTDADMKAAGVGNVSAHPPMVGRGGAKLVLPMRPALADDRVMHVGQAVALVVAGSAADAQDAGEKVGLDSEELDPVVDAAAAVKPGATQLWPEAPGNIGLDWAGLAKDPDANAREIDEIIKSAAHVARRTQFNQLIFPSTMDTRGSTPAYDHPNTTHTPRYHSHRPRAPRPHLIPATA